MIFIETKLHGAFIIEPERLEDHRGFFARTFDEQGFAERGLETRWVQCSISFNKQRGTLRGMHYQITPYAETKLVRCTMGAIYDVIIDLRVESSTFKQWVADELTAENRRMFYIPKGFAHGFLTLMDDTEVYYQIAEVYHPECTRGVRWDDPTIDIHWPLPNLLMSDRDRNFPDSKG